ncbi:MAG: dockerin type I domain-containing protein [Archaeoglobales archaeon]|nr:dockerin type I domain-containing protein [Archaeoglobales archaeon]
MKLYIWIFVVLAIFCLAEAVEAVGIKVVNNAEIVLGDRSDNKIKIIDDRNLRDGLNYNDLEIVAELRRDYEDRDAIAICDVNGDGLGEIVFGDASDDRVHIYDRNLVEKTSIDVGFEGEDDLACGDVDGDGKDEIVVGDSSGDRIIIIQVGAQQNEWSPWTAYISIPHGFWGGDRIAVCDVLDSNRAVGSDGRAEIIVADTDDDKIHIYEYIGGGGSDRGSEIKNFDVKFQVRGRDTIQYDVEDEIACGDVDGDGVDEIVYGNGVDTHKIYVYNANGSIKFEFDAYFDSSDELAVGDVNMDGKDEIIKGDADSDRLHVYDFNGNEIAVINVDYETADGVAVGDVDGDSLAVEEVSCQDTTIANQVIAVINAPPKNSGVNYNSADPLYTDFYVEYKNRRQEQTSLSFRTVADSAFSAKFSANFGVFGIAKSSIENGINKMSRIERYRGESRTVTIAEGLRTEYRDFVIAATYDVRVCEFRILKPQNLAVIDGQQQYMVLTIPRSSPTISSRELVFPQDYTSNRITQIHTVGNILTYPSLESGLVNYEMSKKILSRRFTVGSGTLDYYYSQESSTIDESKKETSIRSYLGYRSSVGGFGNSISVSLRGDYGTQQISTAKLSFTEQTDFHVHYRGHSGFISQTDKMYDATFVLYYDNVDGHLVLDWLVPAHGSHYATDYSRFGSNFGQVATNRTQMTNIGGLIWGEPFAAVDTTNPYLYVENSHALKGAMITIPIKIQNAKDLRNMDIELRYNPSILVPRNANAGSLTQNSLLESNLGTTVKVALVDQNGINGNGTILAIDFEVTGDENEECSLTLSASGNKLNGESVTFSIGNAIFRVDSENATVSGLRGDCNGDGRITSVDALMALQMAVGRIPVNMVADMNNDMQVTSLDAAQILELSTQTSSTRASELMNGYNPGIKYHEIANYARVR